MPYNQTKPNQTKPNHIYFLHMYKQELALNNLQGLIYRKVKTTKQLNLLLRPLQVRVGRNGSEVETPYFLELYNWNHTTRWILVSYPGHLLGDLKFYPSEGIQFAYFYS